MSDPAIFASFVLTGRRPARCLRRVATALILTLALPGARALAECLPVAAAPPGIVPAALSTPVAAGALRLTFLGHASFLMETPRGASVVTDYNGAVRAPFAPTVVTMNNAHRTHYTDTIEPGVRHVLRGWDQGDGPPVHDVTVEDLRVRNVPTNVRGYGGGTRFDGNSIFVFEAAGLCVAHLGHIHHMLTDEQLGALGLIDVVLAPVDGTYTIGQEELIAVIERIRPSLVVPMHYFGTTTLTRFVDAMRGRGYGVDVRPEPVVTLTRAALPYRTVLVLPGY